MVRSNLVLRNNDLKDYGYIFKPFNPPTSNQSLKIMMIDDNPKDIRLFEELLALDTMLNFSLSKWNNSHKAIEALEHHRVDIDLIVLDLLMPCMNGKMILKRLKETTNLKNIPVVIYSSMHNYENAIALNQLEAHAFFAKPLDAESFEAFISGKS